MTGINNTQIPLSVHGVWGRLKSTSLKSVILNKYRIQKFTFKITKFLRGMKQSSGQQIFS